MHKKIESLTQVLLMFVLMTSILHAKNRGTGEGTFLKDAKESPSAILAGLTHKDPSYVTGCLGLLLSSELFTDVTADQIKSLVTLSKKVGYLDKIAFLLVFSHRKEALREALYKEGLSGRTILSASLAYEARLKNLDLISFGDGGISGEKNKKSKKNKSNNIASAKDWIAELRQESNGTIMLYVALAGALNGESAILDFLQKNSSKDSFYKACEVLLQAESNVAPNEADLVEIYNKCSKPSRPFVQVDGNLSSLQILIPPQALLCQAIAKMKSKKYPKVLELALGEKDIRIKIEAIRAIIHTSDETLLPNILKMLNKETFPVQVEILKAIVALPEVQSIPYLIEAVEKEEGFLRRHVYWALSCFAGESVGNYKADVLAWKERFGKSFELNQKAFQDYKNTTSLRSTIVEPFNTDFYDLDIVSKNFVYVVDTSASMKGPRIESLKENLAPSIRRIRYKGTQFNIVDFGGDIVEFQTKTLSSDINKAVTHVNEFTLSSATRSFDALERTFALSDFDTMIFLSDGAPTGYQLKNWNDILLGIAFLNQYRNVVIDCVEFGAGENGLEAMKALSFATNGKTGAVFLEAAEEEEDAKGAKKKKK